MTFAKRGDRVMDSETGKVICKVKEDLLLHHVVSAADFYEFAEGEEPWVAGMMFDPRCIRQLPPPDTGLQMFIEGEWRP